jgi:hypothetical protein
LDIDLDKGAGQLLLFPRRGRFAGAQPHDHVLPPRGLARMKCDVLNDSVALVEDAEHGNALGHRCHTALSISGRGDVPRARHGRVALLSALAARGECERSQQRCGNAFHAYFGIQGS